MTKVKKGDTVKVHYIGVIENGTEFDNSYKRKEPLEFTLGTNQLIPGFENALVGMEIGEKKTVDITSDNAYGQHQKELIVIVPREEMPVGLKPVVGQVMQVSQADGHVFAVSILAVTEKEVTLDANHPLAGKNLTFSIELLEILPEPTCDCGHEHHHH